VSLFRFIYFVVPQLYLTASKKWGESSKSHSGSTAHTPVHSPVAVSRSSKTIHTGSGASMDDGCMCTAAPPTSIVYLLPRASRRAAVWRSPAQRTADVDVTVGRAWCDDEAVLVHGFLQLAAHLLRTPETPCLSGVLG
jgi:hypothetical protein